MLVTMKVLFLKIKSPAKVFSREIAAEQCDHTGYPALKEELRVKINDAHQQAQWGACILNLSGFNLANGSSKTT